MRKVYITKYVLTQGILEAEGELIENRFHGSLSGYKYKQMYFNNDFHLTKEDALKDAESRRLKKIESLKKQIDKLEKLKIKFK